jgi:hypothetical protein
VKKCQRIDNQNMQTPLAEQSQDLSLSWLAIYLDKNSVDDKNALTQAI